MKNIQTLKTVVQNAIAPSWSIDDNDIRIHVARTIVTLFGMGYVKNYQLPVSLSRPIDKFIRTLS